MRERLESLAARLQERLGPTLTACVLSANEVAIEIAPSVLLDVSRALRDEDDFKFEMLMDLAGVDYLEHGVSEWTTNDSTSTGFSRGVEQASFGRFSFHDVPHGRTQSGPRFAVSYQLLSVSLNQRLRIKVFCENDEMPIVDSVTGIWASANWYEREAFDLYGVMFQGHPDLRRILTDYGFIGHPFRKDFPLIGNVEMRYDPEQGRVIYEPVSIEPRVLVPKVIREDHRYVSEDASEEKAADA